MARTRRCYGSCGGQTGKTVVSGKLPNARKVHLRNKEVDLGSVVPILEGQVAMAKDEESVIALWPAA